MLDAADLGLTLDDEQCQSLTEALGMPPPWPLASLKSFFDSQFPAWDEAPVLAVSSPLSQLRGLAEAFNNKGFNERAEAEALSGLGQEVKHAQIRIMCTKARGSTLEDECNFLLIILEQVGTRLWAEREGRRSESEAAKLEISQIREDLRREANAAVAAAKAVSSYDFFTSVASFIWPILPIPSCGSRSVSEETRTQLDEWSSEAEMQRQRVSRLQRDLDVLQGQEQQVAEMEAKLEALENEAIRWKQAHSNVQEELCEAKSQRSALAVAHEESEGALRELQRRIDAGLLVPAGTSAGADAGSVPSSPPQALPSQPMPIAERGGSVPVGKAFSRGARAALSLRGALSEAELRPAFLAWRCARLQGLREKASVTLLEDFQAGGGGCAAGETCTCCSSTTGKCCRAKWLDAALKLLFQERSAHALTAEAAATREKASSVRSRRRILGAVAAVPLLLLAFLVALEPRLSNAPWALM